MDLTLTLKLTLKLTLEYILAIYPRLFVVESRVIAHLVGNFIRNTNLDKQVKGHASLSRPDLVLRRKVKSSYSLLLLFYAAFLSIGA